MTAERREVVARFFEDQRAAARTPGDAVAEVSERLRLLHEELEIAGELGLDADAGARADREGLIHEASIALGHTCVDAMNGLIASEAVSMPILRQAAVETEAPPLDDAWQRAHNPFMALVEIAASQQERLAGLSDQPNQLYRHLHDSLALAADVATWTAWTRL